MSGKTKTEVYGKLDEARREIVQGVKTSGTYRVEEAVKEWLADVMADRDPKTVKTQRELLDPLLTQIGAVVLRDLEADDVSKALAKLAIARTSRTVRDTRASLVRAITCALAVTDVVVARRAWREKRRWRVFAMAAVFSGALGTITLLALLGIATGVR